MNKKEIIKFTIILAITCIIFAPYLVGHYATDTYNITNVGYKEYAINWSLKDGRIFMAIIGLIANAINLPIQSYTIITLLLALLISTTAVIILKNMMIKLKNTENKFLEIIAIIISYISIFNFMYVENLYFVESIVMSISILMYILAVKEITEKSKFYYIKALIFAIIATFSYQGTIGLFVIYGFVFSIAKNKENKKEIIKDIFIIISIALISFLINVLQINIVTAIIGEEQTRLEGIQRILPCIKHVLSRFQFMVVDTIIINSCNLFPKTLMILYVIALLVTSMIYEIKNKEEKLLIKIISLIILSILITTSMCIISIASYDTGRIHNNIGALVGIIFICIFCNSEIFNKNKNIKLIATGILLTYTTITIINTCNLLIQHKIVNKLEQEQCKSIEEYVQNYEKEHNIQVEEARYFKANGKIYGFFNKIPNKSVLTYNGTACTWSSIGTINFYTNRNFENIRLNISENEELYEKYLKEKDNGYDNNFVIIDNILYYTVFI